LAYVVQLHNAIYSESAVEYLNRAMHSINRDRPVILVGHQFAGSALARFNATVRELKVAAIIHGHYHCDQQHDRNHCDFRDNQPLLLIDRFGADFTNVFGAVIPRITSNAAFHNIFWSITLDDSKGTVKLKRYDNHHVARDETYVSTAAARLMTSPRNNDVRDWRYMDDDDLFLQFHASGSYATAAATSSGSHHHPHRRRHLHRRRNSDYHSASMPPSRSRSFQFSLLPFKSPNVTPFFPRNHISLRYLGMWPATFQQLVEVQFNENGFNLPYHDGRALACTYILANNRCVDHYRLRYL